MHREYPLKVDVCLVWLFRRHVQRHCYDLLGHFLPLTKYIAQGIQDDLITSLAILSNIENSDLDARTGFSLDSVTVQILDTTSSMVFEETVSLP